jgi:multiple antibiotic resistance protein
MADAVTAAFVTLFVTIDPAGLAPIFLGLTAGMSPAKRAEVAVRGTLAALGILVFFALAGTAVLDLFGITIHAFRIAGGLLLFTIAFEMIFERRQERQQRSAARAVTADEVHNTAIFPLAIPLIAGPGAISATILLSGQFGGVTMRALLIAIVAVSLAVTYLTLLLAQRIERYLGPTGRTVLTRLLGVILAALAVQFVADGVLAFVRSGGAG